MASRDSGLEPLNPHPSRVALTRLCACLSRGGVSRTADRDEFDFPLTLAADGSFSAIEWEGDLTDEVRLTLVYEKD